MLRNIKRKAAASEGWKQNRFFSASRTFFFVHHWIQLTKLHQNGGSQLNLKISLSIVPPY